MPRDFGGVRSLLLLPLRAVAAAPCAARPVAGGLDGDQERESWSTLQHPGLLEKEGGGCSYSLATLGVWFTKNMSSQNSLMCG